MSHRGVEMANKWLKQLTHYEDSVNYDYDSFLEENCLYTPSPYWNWIFANKANGIPKNSTLLEYSVPKAGKSLGVYSIIDEMQRRDKEGIAIYFNTELRGALQHNVFSTIDKERMIIYDTNDPVEIFDRVEKDIKPMVQDGMPLRIIAIDSLTQIMGVKRDDAKSVADHLMGDHALTVQIGLSKLIPFCKRNKILHIATEQMRANMDAGKYAPKEKAAATWSTKHTYEYAISFNRVSNTDADKLIIEDKTFTEDLKDAKQEALRLEHKVYVKMEGNSVGQAGRAGVFTLNYKQGIINQHEEIFWLGKNTGIIKLEGQKTYIFGKEQFNGKKECAQAIKEDQELAKAIMFCVKGLDANR
jgi:hypothetical protein